MSRALKLRGEKNPAIQRIADMLVKAFEEIGPKILKELTDAYRDYARMKYNNFIEAAKTRTGEIHPRKDQMYGIPSEFAGLHTYASFDTKKAEGVGYSTYSRRRETWEEIRPFLEFYSLTYKYADESANVAYENARDSFVHKNLGKMRTVIGSRTDLKNAVIKFEFVGGAFEGNLQVYMKDVYIRAEVSVKYVIRRIPRVTPYFQYPLVFAEAEVSGKRYTRPSEGELRILLGATKSAAEEKREVAAAAGVCSMSGQYVPEALLKGLYSRTSIYVKCPGCGAFTSVIKGTWKFRNHKTPGAERAGAATKLETAGYCRMSREKVSPETIGKIGPISRDDDYKDPKVACEVCGQSVRLDAEKDWIYDPVTGDLKHVVVKSARYYKHRLAK